LGDYILDSAIGSRPQVRSGRDAGRGTEAEATEQAEEKMRAINKATLRVAAILAVPTLLAIFAMIRWPEQTFWLPIPLSIIYLLLGIRARNQKPARHNGWGRDESGI
jgi:hypothetical protein